MNNTMVKIKDFPKEELPRERFLLYGSDTLTNEELISIILRTGTTNKSVKDLASEVLSKCKSINGLKDLTIDDLNRIKGLGKVKAITLLSALELGRRVYDKNRVDYRVKINNSVDAYNYFSKYICGDHQENLLVIFLNNSKQYIGHKIIFKGTINKSIINSREIIKEALRLNSNAIILMHNHPSGNIKPSHSDDIATNEIIKSCNLMDITLLDHLIVSNYDYYSYLEEGKIKYE